MGRSRIPMSVHLDRNRTVGAPDECWPWTGRLNKQGYGHIRTRSRSVNAQRVAYEEANGVTLPNPSVAISTMHAALIGQTWSHVK